MLTAQSARSLLPFCLLVLVLAPAAFAQTAVKEPFYARTNSFGVFFAYSDNSSHILMGAAQQRKLLEIGASYGRRILLNRTLNWQYDGEILPVAMDSDPVETTSLSETYGNPPKTVTDTFRIVPPTACHSSTNSVDIPPVIFSVVTTCSRRWVYGGGISPVGFRWNFLPYRTLQPFLVGHGGFIESVDAIPVRQAGSFNFTFDGGAGFEWYRSHSRSWRVEYRYHHISNKDTAPQNPGIDNSLFQISYVFGR